MERRRARVRERVGLHRPLLVSASRDFHQTEIPSLLATRFLLLLLLLILFLILIFILLLLFFGNFGRLEGKLMADVSLILLVLKTRQVEQLRLFYQVLGINLIEEQHGTGPIHFAGRVGDTVLEVYPLAGDSTPVAAAPRLGFAVENLAEVVRKLQDIGSTIVTPPKASAEGMQAVVKDPDGRAVELMQRG
jgi:lactoylglutathione lyase